MNEKRVSLKWVKVADTGELPDGRAKVCSIDRGDSVLQVCLTHHEGRYGALDNVCPHQGGPLGEGTIENGCLRCPWHGWDFDPITGKPPGGYDDGVATYPVEARDDGVYIAIEEEGPHKRTVTDVMAETMVNWGVTHVFGMVGHSNLGVADAIRRRCLDGEMEYIGIRHEGAAAFAASAFGKLTGDPAACFAIAGPGSTNMLTGCWDAHVDRAPMLALCGQVNQQVFGPGAFQELPLTDAFAAVSRFNHTALPASNHAELMSLALKTAKIERDVANIVFPDDVQTQAAAEGTEAGSPDGRIADNTIAPPPEALARAVELLREAKRPVIIVGHGARFEMDSVRALAEELKCPVLTTFKGKGLIGDSGGPAGGHPLGGGVLGRSGTPIASWFMNESEVLLVFGASFSNHTGITPKKATIQVDSDRFQLGRFHAVDVPLLGDVGVTAHALLDALKGQHKSIDHTGEVAERWALWRAEKASRLADDRGEGVSSIAVFDSLNRVAPTNAIYAVDVGNNTYSFGRYLEASGEQAVLMSGYLGSIGFGYPAALGAWAATRVKGRWGGRFEGRPVIAVTGDGGFGQYPFEVTTAVKYGMNITHILLRNDELGKISKEQRAGHWEVWQTGLVNPNIAEFVSSCGGLGIRVDKASELDEAMRRALTHDGPATVEVLTDAELI
ncbi:MAG: thiamine pyrophosphate-binding protein [Planctomycetota bacterium]